MAIIHKSWIVWVVALTRLRTTLTMMSPGSGPLGQAGHTMSLLTKCSLFLPRLRPGARKTRIILRAVTGIVSHDNHNGRYLWLVSDLPHRPLIGRCCPHVSLDNEDMHVTLSCLSLVTAQHHSLVSYPSPELWTCWLHSQIQTRDRGCGDGGYVGFTISLLLPPGRNRLGLTEQLGVSLLVELKTQWRILSILSGWVNSCIKQVPFKPPLPLIKPDLLSHSPLEHRLLSASCRAIYHWMYHSFLALLSRSGLSWSMFVILLSRHHCQQYPSCYHHIQTSIESQDKMISTIALPRTLRSF